MENQGQRQEASLAKGEPHAQKSYGWSSRALTQASAQKASDF